MAECIIFTVLQDVIWLVLLIGGGYLFGKAFFKIYKGEPVFGKRAVGKIEGGIYKLMGVDPSEEMSANSFLRY